MESASLPGWPASRLVRVRDPQSTSQNGVSMLFLPVRLVGTTRSNEPNAFEQWRQPHRSALGSSSGVTHVANAFLLLGEGFDLRCRVTQGSLCCPA